jgi:hypothetical protein
MMNSRIFYLLLPMVVLSSSCSRPTGAGQHATLQMRDGTSVNGTVVSSSPSEIQLAGDDKITRTYAMAQVRSIQYDDPAVPPGADAAQSGGAPPPGDQSHQDHYHPGESAITTRTWELPVGTQISVRNEDTIDSDKAVQGQTFPAEVTRDVRDAAGDVVIPRGSNAQIVIRSASKGGKIRGASDLVMDLASVSIDGRLYDISTADIGERGRPGVGANRRTGEFTGGGAAIGAIIGAIAGGGKGAAIGAGSGAGAGVVTQIVTRGTIKVPVESLLTFKLDMPMRVSAPQ